MPKHPSGFTIAGAEHRLGPIARQAALLALTLCGSVAAGLAGAVVGGVLARWAYVARLVGLS